MTAQPRDVDRLATEYALGLLQGTDLARAEALLADPAFRWAVGQTRKALRMLVGSAPEVEPRPDLLRAIKTRIAVQTEAEAARADAAQQAGWRTLVPGVRFKSLRVGRRAGQRSLLLRFAPGAVLPAHPHPHDEACVVLEGAVVSNGVALRAGDHQVIPAGTAHLPVTSAEGALVFVQSAGGSA